MRPYLAILLDSFREALHSRVLWMMFAVITLFLVIIFPFHFQDKLNNSFQEEDVSSWPLLASAMLNGAPESEGAGKPIALIYENLSPDTKGNLAKIAKRGKPAEKEGEKKDDDRPENAIGNFFAEAEQIGRLHRDLRGMILNKDLYDADVWRGISLKREARELVDKGDKRTVEERQRLNRLLIEQQFPNLVAESESRAFGPKYAIWESKLPIPVPREQVKRNIPLIATEFVNWTFGVFGIALSFLVTAPLITQMFEPGSLHVLVSKPISRTLLLLSKFVGGCTFTVLGAAYFLVGVWLYMGIQLGIWEPGLLAGILVYAFMFAVYYTIVIAAALYWRNVIIAIVAGVAAWGFCVALSWTHYWFDALMVQPSRPRSVVTANEIPILAREDGETNEWVAGAWRPSYRATTGGRNPFNVTVTQFGPLFVPAKNQVVSVQRSPFRGTETKLSVANDEPGHPRTQGPDLPMGTSAMFVDKRGELLLVGVVGVMRQANNEEAKPPTSIFGINLSFGANKDFKVVGTYELETPPRAAAYDPGGDRIVLACDGQLAILKADESNQYQQKKMVATEGDEFKRPKLAFVGDRIVVAGRDGKIAVVDAETLAVVKKAQLENNNGVRFMHTSPDGKVVAIGFDNGRVYVVRAANPERFVKLDTWSQGDLWAATFEDNAHLLVAQSRGQLVRFRVGETGDSTGQASRAPGVVADPPMVTAEMFFYWGVKPVYELCPKPGELNRTLTYLLTGKETISFGGNQQGNEVYRGSPWSPLISSGIFMLVVLALSCLYFEWQDL